MDYESSPYTKALADGKDRYLIFEGKISEPEKSAIPRGDRFEKVGAYDTKPPCTLNGFIACRSDEILPEYHVYGDDQYPANGAVIWDVENGNKTKAAVYDFNKKRFKAPK